MQGKFNLLVETLTERDKSIDNNFKTLMGRLDRHRGELDGMVTKVNGCGPWVFQSNTDNCLDQYSGCAGPQYAGSVVSLCREGDPLFL